MIINGKSLLLRSVCACDLDLFRKWWCDIDLMRNFDQLPPMTYSQIEQEFKKNLSSHERLDFIIEDKSGKPIGSIYLKNINGKDRNAELHIMITEPVYQNFGFGIEARYHIAKHAFNEMNMHKLYGKILSNDTDNLKVMEFAGFKKEAVCRNAVFNRGQFRDLYIFGLLKTEFDFFLSQEKNRFMVYADVT